MTSDKMKEIREWATFVLSAVTVVAIPIGILILRNQRLEIQVDEAKKYVTLDSYKTDSAVHNQEYGEIKGQLSAVLLEQAHQSDNLTFLKSIIESHSKP